jgi:hypothetical protein
VWRRGSGWGVGRRDGIQSGFACGGGLIAGSAAAGCVGDSEEDAYRAALWCAV